MSQMEAAKAKVQQLRKELDLLEEHVAIVGGALQPLEGSASASGPIGRPPQGKLNLFSQMQAGSSSFSQMASSQMASSGVSSTGGGGGDEQHFKKEKSKSSDVSTFQDGTKWRPNTYTADRLITSRHLSADRLIASRHMQLISPTPQLMGNLLAPLS